MKKQIYPLFMGTLFLFLLLAQGALAKTLSLPLSGALQGNSITLPLTLDTPDGVGGFTCTVSYDTRRLRFLSVENLSKSISDGAGCVQSPSSCSASTVASTLYYRVNTATPGKIKIAAASAVPLTSSSVLGLRFKVKNTAPSGRANITLSPTTLTLASAGYQTATELPVLMGMPAASTNGDGFYTTPTFTTQFSHGGIQVVDPLGIAGSRQVEENARPRYTTTGGSGSGVTWSASQGQISSQGVFTPPNVTQPTVVTITAKDRTYNETTLNPIKTLLNVTVHPQVAINGKPTTPYQISAGGTLNFAAKSGPSNLRWEVTKKGATTATGQGQTFAFTAPETGAFAGVYTIRVFDANGFEDTHTIKVPLTVSPSRAVVLEGGRFDDIVLSGAPQGTRFHTKVCRNTETSAARDLGQLNPKTNQPNHFTYVAPSAPNGITENKTITLRFTAQDTDLTSEGLANVATGLWTLQDLAGVTGVVKGSGNTPVEGATVSALLAEPVSTVTDSQGRFTLLLPKTNAPITLYVNAPGYIEKSLTSSELTGNDVITLTPTASQKEISGTLRFDAGLTARPARIRIKDQNGWITRTDGTQVSTTSHPQTGRYTLVLPENASITGALTIEASAMECVTTSRILPENISLDGTTPIDLTLLALTWIEAEETRLPSGEIKITLTATAGSHRFDGTANEVRVSINNQIISGLSYDSATKSWSFTRPTDQNFSYLVQADVSKTPHNVTSGYSGRRHFRHIKGAGTPLASVIENPGLLGGTMVSPDETMGVEIPVGGLLKGVHTKVTIELQHSHTSGASRINRSGLVQVLMLDQMGNPVDNSTIQELRITIPFNASSISRNGLTQNPNIHIYHAPTVEDLISGRNVKTLPKSQIISVDDTRGTVTFRVDHLTVFGVGEVTPNPAPPSSGGGGGGGGGCFINATSGDSPSALNGIGALLLLALLAMSIKTRHTRAKKASPNR